MSLKVVPECSICFDPEKTTDENPIGFAHQSALGQSQCAGSIHKNCLSQCLKIKSVCPFCREDLSRNPDSLAARADGRGREGIGNVPLMPAPHAEETSFWNIKAVTIGGVAGSFTGIVALAVLVFGGVFTGMLFGNVLLIAVAIVAAVAILGIALALLLQYLFPL